MNLINNIVSQTNWRIVRNNNFVGDSFGNDDVQSIIEREED